MSALDASVATARNALSPSAIVFAATALEDLLTDLMHWSYRTNTDFHACLEAARKHYLAEV